MALASTALVNLAAGEISPKAGARIDTGLFFSGAQRIENFIVEPNGSARYRNGFRYVQETEENAGLVPFIFNDEQSYALEFTHKKCRVFFDGAPVVISTSPNPITAVTNTPLPTITSSAHGLSPGDEIQIKEVNGPAGNILNVGFHTVSTVPSTTTFTLSTTSKPGSFSVSPNSLIQKVVSFETPYKAFTSDLKEVSLEAPEFLEMQTAQVGNTMYIAHKNHAPRKLVRTSNTSWSISTYTRTSDPFGSSGNYPRAVAFHESRIFFASTTNNPQSIWGSAAAEFDKFTLETAPEDTDAVNFTVASRKPGVIAWLQSTDKFLVGGMSSGNYKIYGATEEQAITPTSITVRPLDFLGSAQAQPDLNEERVVFIERGRKRVRKLDFSLNADSYKPVDLMKASDHIGSSGIKQISASIGIPNILWGAKYNGELIGASIDDAESVAGWHRQKTRVGDKFTSVISLPRANGLDQTWVIVERTVDSKKRFFIEVLEDPVDFVQMDDVYTGDQEADEAAFRNQLFEDQRQSFHLDCGYTYSGLELNQTIELEETSGTGVELSFNSLAFFNTLDIGREIWEYNGTGRAKIISAVDDYTITVDIISPFSSTTIDAYYITVEQVAGLNHLEGATVQVVTDGAIHSEQVVEDGVINLDYPAAVIHVGFSYTGIIKTFQIEAGVEFGPAQNKLKNIHRLGVRVLNTLGLTFGKDSYSQEDAFFRRDNDLASRVPPLYTGDIEIPMTSEWKRDAVIVARQARPLPATILGFFPYLEVTEK